MDFYSCYYYVFITSNVQRSQFFIGVAGSLKVQLGQWSRGWNHPPNNCIHLMYWEQFEHPEKALSREKKLKRYSRRFLLQLICDHNPAMYSLNEKLLAD